MELLVISLLAGVLTILSPCVLPLLPVVLTGSLAEKDRTSPLIITASLAVSVVVFTLLIRGTTAFIQIPTQFWFTFSGLMIIAIGSILLFPGIWDRLSVRFNLLGKSSGLVTAANSRSGQKRNIMLGAALGPVFTSCSPTYGLILAAVLPVNLLAGLAYLLTYTLAMSAVMLAIAYGGQKVVNSISWAADSRSKFKRVLGAVLIFIGLLIATGLIKDFEIWLVETAVDLTRLEWRLLE